MKICILIIYSKNDYYDKMLEIQRKNIHKSKNNNVDVYFIQSSYEHNVNVYFDNDMIHVRSDETHSNILYKTINAMDTLINFYKKEYDFIVRSNISTLIDMSKLVELLNMFKYKEYIYAGDIRRIMKYNKHINFALGTCIILSNKLAKKMVNEKNKFDHSLEDDVSFGLFVQENIPEAFNHNLSTRNLILYTNTLENGFNSKLNDFINFANLYNNKLNYILYRNSTSNRFEDANIMNYICDNIINY